MLGAPKVPFDSLRSMFILVLQPQLNGFPRCSCRSEKSSNVDDIGITTSFPMRKSRWQRIGGSSDGATFNDTLKPRMRHDNRLSGIEVWMGAQDEKNTGDTQVSKVAKNKDSKKNKKSDSSGDDSDGSGSDDSTTKKVAKKPKKKKAKAAKKDSGSST